MNVDTILQMHPKVYPYLATRVVPTMYHIIVLPKRKQGELVEIARTQVSYNKLKSCLVLGDEEAIYFDPDGSEARSSIVPFGGVLINNQLKPCRIFPEDQELRAREEALKKYIESLNQRGHMLGDLTKGMRKATPQEADNLRGLQEGGVPKGLVLCSQCGEWQGACLDPSHLPEKEYIVQVHCRCQNDNLCALCGDLLSNRKLNANYYNTEDGKIWHVPGFCGFKHICKRPALN